MRYGITASITEKAAARLLISGEIDIDTDWPGDTAVRVLEAVRLLPTEELLRIADGNPYGEVAETAWIPQFGKVRTLQFVPDYFKQGAQADYAQMGFFLKKDPLANLGANEKFGENHGKTAAMLGLIRCENCRFVPSALTYAFCELSEQERGAVVQKLLFRVPIVQMILKKAATGKVNGYSFMMKLSESTRLRRGTNVKNMLDELERLSDTRLLHRLHNVKWVNDGGTTDAETEV